MRGFNTKKAQSCKDGGLIRGPGTGTSDSIPRGFKPGTFIMPADSTKAIGPDVLENIAKVPTKVSNGEFAHTPQEVHAVGINALRMMKDATHSPKDAGVYFANGGAVQGRGAKGFAIGGEVTNEVTRIGNSYSGGNVGGNITVNGQQPSGTFSSASPVPTPAPPRPAPVAPVVQAVQYMQPSTPATTPATPALSAMATPPATPQAVAKPVDAFTARNNAVSASSITNNGGRFDTTPAVPSTAPVDTSVTPRRSPVGFDPMQPAQKFADGGDVRGFKPEPQRLVDGDVVKRRQISAQNIYPQGSPSAGADIYANVGRGPAAPSVLETDPQAQADRSAISKMASGIRDANQNAGRAILDVASIVPRGLAGAYDSAVVRPMRAAGINAGYLSPHLVPDGVDPASMTPFTDQKRLQERNAAGAGRGFVNPSLSSKAVAPVTNLTVPETLTDAQRGGGNVDAVEAPTTQPSAQPAPAQPVAQALAQVPSLAPVQAQGFQAPSVRHSGNNWKSENDLRNLRVSASSIMNNGGRWDQHGKGVVSPERAAYLAMLETDNALRQAQPGADVASMRENAGIQREGMQQFGATTRTGMQEQGFATRDQRKAGVDERTLAMQEAESGFKTRAQAQLESLRNTLLDPNATTEQKAQAQAQISAINVNGGQSGEWGVQVTPATKNVDGSTTAGSIVKYNKRTGETEVVGQPGQGGGAQPSANHLAALKANPKQAAQFDEVYGPGAAARALKGG